MRMWKNGLAKVVLLACLEDGNFIVMVLGGGIKEMGLIKISFSWWV